MIKIYIYIDLIDKLHYFGWSNYYLLIEIYYFCWWKMDFNFTYDIKMYNIIFYKFYDMSYHTLRSSICPSITTNTSPLAASIPIIRVRINPDLTGNRITFTSPSGQWDRMWLSSGIRSSSGNNKTQNICFIMHALFNFLL